jgi:hypothetical protein
MDRPLPDLQFVPELNVAIVEASSTTREALVSSTPLSRILHVASEICLQLLLTLLLLLLLVHV